MGCASLHKSLVIASCLCPTDGFKLSRSKGRAISSVLLNAAVHERRGACAGIFNL